MSCNYFNIRFRTIKPIFGYAFPGKQLSERAFENFLEAILKQKVCSDNRNDVFVMIAGNKKYEIVVDSRIDNQNDSHIFRSCLKLRSFIKSVKRQNRKDVFKRFWLYIFRKRNPSNFYLINKKFVFDVYTWLQENSSPDQYKFFTEFNDEIILSFRKKETETMFRLKFPEFCCESL